LVIFAVGRASVSLAQRDRRTNERSPAAAAAAANSGKHCDYADINASY